MEIIPSTAAERQAALEQYKRSEIPQPTLKVIAERASSPNCVVTVDLVKSFQKGRGKDTAPSCAAIWKILNSRV
jgi:hypothetical protein